MSESLDRKLNARERIRLKLHFLVCTWCSRYLQQITTIRGVVRIRCEEIESGSGGLSAEARARISKSLRELQ